MTGEKDVYHEKRGVHDIKGQNNYVKGYENTITYYIKEIVMKYGSQFDLVLKHTDEKGKGIFANEHIPANSNIFTNLVIPIPEQELDKFKDSFLRYHLLYWDTTFAIGLGCAIYLNHSDSPNVKFVRHFDDDFLEVFSIVPISKGAELTHRYANPQRHPSIVGSYRLPDK